ncbi:CHAD domain-containing protein [Paraburkholderia phenazinium]|jgi:CHAD domain-containing protein|uniref:CHAD domain-containing protein n=1 Tax=Paraburkholderia phenazinium TaxID=60549 RepID=A0A1G8KNJ3_9BURK|nr:CHAD domain-containing protein [Paraburkholderia phenazinium]SDI44977.1 CHAD domain-containing protein [Paraburkholderia phenazinium]
MARVYELVLDIPTPAAQAWLLQLNRSKRPHTANRLDAALVKALTGLPATMRARRARSPDVGAVYVRAKVLSSVPDCNEKLAAAGLQIMLDTSTSRRRVVVCQQARYSPGVTVREILFEAPLEAGVLVGEALAAAPEELRHTLAEAGEFAPLTTLASQRDHWQWCVTDDIVVDIVFERPMAASSGEAPLHRELHLSTPCVENAAGPSLSALFAVAYELVAALPAFPVLHSALAGAHHGADDPKDDPATPVRAAPIHLSGISTPHAALIAIGENLAEHWFGNDVGVRDAVSTEFVHQMRVAQRRLRTALRIFPHWADEMWKTRIAPDLKWLGTVLGEARDWDVFVDTTLPGLAAADLDSAAWDTTRELADAQRLEARERACSAVGSARYARLALAWLEWLSGLLSREPPAKTSGHSLRAYARKRVNKYYKRLVGAPKLTTLDETARHQERIQAKYLRYTLEFFESIASRKTRSESVKTVSRMQSVLGEGNDAVVALRHLEQIDVPPYQSGFARGWCEASQRYTAQEGERLLRRLCKPKISGGAAR